MNTETTTANDTHTTAGDFADDAPKFAAPLANCWNWSANFRDFAPFRMLLDLTGYSADNFDANLHNWEDRNSLGAYDLGTLADALTAWAENPTGCAEWVRQLLELEARN